MKNKLLSALAILLLLSSVSCGGTSAPAEETSPSGQTKSTEAPETEEPSALDLLPADLDFGGYAFHIVYAAPLDLTYETYISMEEENGDILWDNSYYRNRAVEERYNVDLQFVPLGAEQGGYTIVPDVSKSVLAGDDAYQYIQFNSAWDNTVSLIAENALLDLNTLPGLDPYGPGFYAEVNQNFTISDRLYFAFSNYNSSGALPLYMVFNKNMIRDAGLDMPYDLILSGGWTMDVLEEYIKGVSADLNGDGKITGEDRHGLASGDLISNYIVFGADVRVVKRDDRGAYLPDLQNNAFISAAQRFLDFKLNNPDVFIGKERDVGGGTGAAHMFLLGNSMFAHTGSGLSNTNMRAIDTFDFGVAPFPKFDEAQNGYGNYLALNQFGIPQTVSEPEIAAAVAQGLAVTSQVMYSPVFLDVYLESKLLRDEESVKVIDMMRSDPLVDVSRYFDFADGAITPVNLLSKIKDAGSVVSQCEKTESAAVKKAGKFFDVFFE